MDLCLNMIVRDEAEGIAETLANILDYFPVVTWVIHDTGSCDNTVEIIETFFATRNIPGTLRKRTWENFGANRQFALEDAKGRAPFILFFDADNRISGSRPVLDDSYGALMLNTRRDGVVYPIKAIVRDGAYRWRGVVHEGLYPVGPEGPVGHVHGDYTIESRRAGARSKDQATYYRDAMALVTALENLSPEDEDLRARYTFYCANSWRDAHAPNEAAAWYKKRLTLGGWTDELYLSWLGLGIERVKTNARAAAIESFLSGTELCPERAECFYHLARYLRLWGKPEAALQFARRGLQCPPPDDSRLFVWRDVYRFWMDFEYLHCLRDLGRSEDGMVRSLAHMKANGAPKQLFRILGVDIVRR